MSRDEVYTFFVARDNGFMSLLLQKHWDTAHPPLYYVFAHYWQSIGISTMALRAPSIFVSAINLALIPVATYAFGFSSLFTVIFLGFMAISPKFVTLMMFARPYFLELVFATLSLISFANITSGSKVLVKHFVVFSVLTFMSDYSGVWLLMAYGLFWLASSFFGILKKNVNLVILKSLFMIFTFLIPSIVLMFVNFDNSISLEVGLLPLFRGQGNPITNNLYQLSSLLGTLDSDFLVQSKLLSFDQWNLAVLLIATLGFGRLLYLRKDIGLFFGLLFFATTLFSFVFSVYITPIFLAINLNLVSYAAVFGYTAVVIWICELRNNLLLVSLLGLVLASPYLYGYRYATYSDTQYDWRGLAEQIVSDSTGVSSEPLIFVSSQPDHYFKNIEYYSLLMEKKIKYLVYPASALSLGMSQDSFMVINFQGGERGELTRSDWDKLARVYDCKKPVEREISYIDYLKCSYRGR